MLKRLGRRLTLLNVLISGAILIVMALISLSITERMMQGQNESDLNGYMRTLVTAMFETQIEGAKVRIQVPQKYLVYVENEDAQRKLITDRNASSDVAYAVLPEMREEIGEQLQSGQTGANGVAASGSPVFISFSRVQSEGDSGEARPAELMTSEAVAVTMAGVKLSTVGNTPYRIAASMIGEEKPYDMLLVMQDQTQEIAERNRLRMMYALCVLGALALIVLGSLYYSAKAVQPVEQSIRRQQEFVSAASHELRTPIASVRANAEVLNDAALGEYAPYLGAILSESEKMSRLVSDLLHLARADAGELPVLSELTDAAEVARDAAQLIEPLAQRQGLTLHKKIQPALMMGDSARLRQVLVALLDNAATYTPEGGEIWITTGKRDQFAEIRVEDNGPGISGEHKARVFDRFYRVDSARSRAHGGAGLGLSIARELAERMNGHIQLQDRAGGGSAFTVTFPLVTR